MSHDLIPVGFYLLKKHCSHDFIPFNKKHFIVMNLQRPNQMLRFLKWFFSFYLADVETKMREVTVFRRLVSTVAIFYILGYTMVLLLARPKENLMCQTYHQGSGENCHSLN